MSEYRPYLLENLYKRMIIWKEQAYGTKGEKAVSLAAKHVSIKHKTRYLLSLHAPILLELLGKRICLEYA